MDFEAELFKIAPWAKPAMQQLKLLNNRSFMRGREGWIHRRIENPESIYEHTCKMGLGSYYLFGNDRSIAIALAHDMPEVYSPDYRPGQIDPKKKEEEEYRAMLKVASELQDGQFWFRNHGHYQHKRYEGPKIKELDKLDAFVQSCDYANEGKGSEHEKFYTRAQELVQTPELKLILEEMNDIKSSIEGSLYIPYFDRLKELELN